MNLMHYAADTLSHLSDDTILTANQLPMPPPRVTAHALRFEKGWHDYDSFRVDAVSLICSKEACFRLALITLASLLHDQSADVMLELGPSESGVRNLIICPSREITSSGLCERPIEFRYTHKKLRKHPWYPRQKFLPRWELPFLALTDLADSVVSEADRAMRDTVRGFGTPRSCANFADLLLNAAHAENSVVEILLEQEPGFVGVAPGSCELKLWLPGSLLNDERFFADPRVDA